MLYVTSLFYKIKFTNVAVSDSRSSCKQQRPAPPVRLPVSLAGIPGGLCPAVGCGRRQAAGRTAPCKVVDPFRGSSHALVAARLWNVEENEIVTG